MAWADGPDDTAGRGGPDDTGGAAGPAAAAGRDLSLAVGTAVLFAVLFIVSAFVSRWALVAFVAVAVVLATLEVDGALRMASMRPQTAVVLLGGPLLLAATFAFGARGQLTALALMVLATVALVLVDRRDPVPLRSAGTALLIALWIPFMASFVALLLRRPAGQWYVVITVGLTAASDIAAYAVGSRIGRRKLAPAVSPGKTWEGVAGGAIAAMLVAGVAAPLLVSQLSIVHAAALGAVIAVVATIGDLAESAVKRSLGIKDFGRMLPGHGGMMDRVDAMLFTLPVAHLVLLAGRL